ncbi:Retrovirus-related Pol polyprotein from transposon TNT 1-94 [Podosphaera aphanis]|nr:Retrovirus-related Pol polyprotein from transposon TNT 1-94 [Podosphaera aphanis]
MRTLHSELAELGIVIEEYLLAIAISKSLPPSYRNCVSMILAGVNNLEKLDSYYFSSKIFEEEQRRTSRSEDANIAFQKRCTNCKRNGHTKENCYCKGGGKEGQGPRQIALRKKQEADKKKLEDSKPKTNDSTAQLTEDIEDAEEVFFSSHMAVAEIDSVHFTGSSWSYDSWVADSGASTHVANQREMFESFNPTKSILNVAGGLTASVEGVGTVCLESVINETLKKFKLSNVLYVPTTRHCLISRSRLDQAGGEARYKNGKCKFLNAKGELIATGELVGNLYRIYARALLNKSHAAYILTNSILSWHEAHRRLGHLSLTSLKLLFKNNRVTGITIDKNEPIPLALTCESRIAAKAHRAPFSMKKVRSSTKFDDLTHKDVWGSPNVKQSPGGNRYFILFIDDFTRYVTVKLMKDKASVKQRLINYCNFVNTQYGRWPKEIRADNAAEYEGTRVWLEEKGIELKTSAPYSPQQNGVSERMNRTLLDLARAMKIEKNLPDTLWGEAVLHAAWIRNRSPSVALNNKTPIEIMTQKEPDFKNVIDFGENVFVLEEISQSKIGPRARKVTFVGFEDGPKAIRYYDPITKVIRVSRNFNFTPNTERTSDLNNDIPLTNPENVQDSNNKSNQEITPVGVENEISEGPQNQNINFKSSTDIVDSRELRSTTTSGAFTRKDYRNLAGFNPRQHIRHPKEFISKNGDDELPNSIHEARGSKCCVKWEEAIQTELKLLQEKNTWEMVDLPRDKNVIGNRWVFTKKFDENGKLSRYKARLVAQGYTQGYIHGYSDTFSPVVRFDSFRLAIAIAAYHGFSVGQMDIKGAYLNGTLDEEIYMAQPKGCEDGSGKVCTLIHTLYGLKQSGRGWNKILKNFLVKNGYCQLIKEHGLYSRQDVNGLDITAVWVDDFLIVSSDDNRLKQTKECISEEWESTDQGVPKLLLGINLERDPKRKTIKIHQEQYILKILRKFGMDSCSPISTPLPTSAVFSKSTDDEVFEDSTRYRAAIGSLMFAAVATRPDIAYATNILAQFNGNPPQKYWNGVKNIFRYLRGTTNRAFSDADNGKGHDRKSISGSVITISGGAIKWTAVKQYLITVSTAESEYVAANLAGRNCLFLRDIMEELGFRHDEPIPLFMDSDGAIALTKNPENMRATIHIDKIYHWIRQYVEEGTFSPESIPSSENPADLFTKALAKPSFDKHIQNIGVV